MSEPVIIQIIITAGAVVVAIVSLIATYANRQDVKDVKDQVKNTHDTNLRQDIDKVKMPKPTWCLRGSRDDWLQQLAALAAAHKRRSGARILMPG